MVGPFSPTPVRSDCVVSLRTFEANYVQQLDAEIALAGVSAATARRNLEQALAEFPTVVPMDRDQVLAAQDQHVFLGSALVSAMRRVGVTELVVPVGQLSWCMIAATLAGLAAGVLPARRAARSNVLDAVNGR